MNSQLNLFISRIEEPTLALFDTLTMLESTDEVTEDNPAFEFITTITDRLFNITMDLMSEIASDAQEGSKVRELYKSILDDFVTEPDVEPDYEDDLKFE